MIKMKTEEVEGIVRVYQRIKSLLPKALMLLPVSIVVLGCLDLSARAEYQKVNWESLDLSSPQRTKLNQLDSEWQEVVSEVVPRLRVNQKKLKKLMGEQHPDEDEILEVQKAIHKDKAKLRMEATQIFLHKRKVLNEQQEEKLQKMLNMH